MALKGTKTSDETKAKIAAALRGRPLSEETKAKLSEKLRGRQFSEETRARISAATKGKPKTRTPALEAGIRRRAEAMRGRKHSEETKAKIGAGNKGKQRTDEQRAAVSAGRKAMLASLPPEERAALSRSYGMKGKKQSPEAIAKVVAAHTGSKRSPEALAKMSAARKAHWENLSPEALAAFKAQRSILSTGRKHTDEERRKMSEGIKRWWENAPEEHHERARNLYLSSIAALGSKPFSSIEVMVAESLDSRGIPYNQQFMIGRFSVDFYLPETREVIEVNGCYWHGCQDCGFSDPEQERRDKQKCRWLEKNGYPVTVIWEHDLRDNRKPKQRP